MLCRSACFAATVMIKRQIELLAPARDKVVAFEAINHGADAVYMGAAHFGARSSAGNSVADIAEVCAYAHRFNARVYVTVNTIIYNNELRDVEALIWKLYYAGADALIVQDMGILRLKLPPIALHASTQCDLRTLAKAQFLEAAGFTQLVLARELTLDEISAISRSVRVPLEAFVHGALCVSYSGRCQASYAICGRSANRGECGQICRLKYDLTDADGNVLLKGKHLLSLRDNNQSRNLRHMIDAGVQSFKIEGRLKDSSYVKNVVAYYRRALDAVIDADDSLQRASAGGCSLTFEPDLHVAFNRGFTDYFLTGRKRPDGYSMACPDSPKSIGEPLGVVTYAHGIELRIVTEKRLSNGDGLSYVNSNGDMVGMRVNRVEGDCVLLRDRVSVSRGTMIYRTHNKRFCDVLSQPSSVRLIAVDLRLRLVNGVLVADCSDGRGNAVTHSAAVSASAAQTPQAQRQTAVLSKMGGTAYCLRHIEALDDVFIPNSALAAFRRELLDLLDRAQAMRFTRPKAGKELRNVNCPPRLGYADNVANRLAERFYREHGVVEIEPAMETWPDSANALGRTVMHTRYCIRREIGCCLQDKSREKLPAKLMLRCGNTVMEVVCNCRVCEMQLVLRRK